MKTTLSMQQWSAAAVLGLCILQPLLFGWAAPETTFQSPLADHYWRLISAHITHIDTAHFMTNVLAWMLLHHLFPLNPYRWLLTTLLALVSINGLLIMLQIPEYAGLSGILYAYLGCLIGIWFNSGEKVKAALSLLGIALYALFISPMDMVHTQTHFQPLLEAHVAGLISGLLAAWLTRGHDKPEKPMPDTIQSQLC